MPNYIIHIGPPKTGTKYLQAAFRQLGSQLERDRILYPNYRWTVPAHFSHEAMHADLREAETARLEEAFASYNASKYQTVLLSCEGFAGLPRNALVLLRKLTEGSPVKIVYFSRRWSDRISSSWREGIRAGQTSTLPQFLNRFISSAESKQEMNFGIVLDKFSEFFGHEALTIFPYSDIIDAGGDILVEFLTRVLNKTYDLARVRPSMNLSLDPETAEALRLLNLMDQAKAVSRRLERALGAAVRGTEGARCFAHLREAMQKDIREILIDDEAPWLKPIYDQLNEKYADKVVKILPNQRVFEPRVTKSRYIGTGYLFEDGVRAAASQLYALLPWSGDGATPQDDETPATGKKPPVEVKRANGGVTFAEGVTPANSGRSLGAAAHKSQQHQQPEPSAPAPNLSVTGYVDLISRDKAVGWAVATDDLNRTVEVAVAANGKELARSPAALPRDGLLALFGSRNHGFSIPLPALDKNRMNHIVVREVTSGQPLPNGETILPPISAADAKPPRANGKPHMRPLLLTSTARSGTTVMMRRLGDHPRISFAAEVPYETKLITYYATAFRVFTLPYLGDDDDRARSIDRLAAERSLIPRNPIFSPAFVNAHDPGATYNHFKHTCGRVLSAGFREMLVDYYSIMANTQNKPEPMYFVEKCDIFPETRATVLEMFNDVAEIVLVRDIRDIIVSQRKFFRSDESVGSKMFNEITKHFLSIFQQSGKKLVVRYEDFIADELGVLNKIAGHLEIEPFAAGNAPALLKLHQVHGTSASAAASVGRWRRELTREEQDNCRQLYREFFDAFGYPHD